MIQNHNYKTALLVMDIQPATIKRLESNPKSLDAIAAINNAIQKARTANIPILFIVLGFRKGYPEISPGNKSFSVIKASSLMNIDTEEGYRVHESVDKKTDDLVIIKKRVSAFTGSDLEVTLRGLQINHLVLTGVATSGVVLSTLREAADKDYILTVLSNACADPDEEIHQVLTTKIFPRQAEVITAEEWKL